MSDGVPAASPKKKKLPFKPTALRRAAPKPTQDTSDNDETGKQDEGDDLELFRRRKEMAPIMAADQERRMRRKQKQVELESELRAERLRQQEMAEKRARQEDEEENATAPQRERTPAPEPSIEVEDMSLSEDQAAGASSRKEPLTQTNPQVDRASDLVTPPPSKRSRLDSSSATRPLPSRCSDSGSVLDGSPTRRLKPRFTVHAPATAPAPASNTASSNAPVVLLDSDSEEDDIRPPPSLPPIRRSSSAMTPADDTPLDSPAPAEEDEFAEYVRRAERQRARERAQRTESGSSQTKEATQILVASEMPGVEPLLVKFVFDKPFRILRKTWIAVQQRKNAPITREEYEDIIFTWRRKKVYNWSTLDNLGIRPQGEGRLVSNSQGTDGFAEGRTRVILEAWTPESFRAMERDEELRIKREAGEMSDEDSDDNNALVEEPEIKFKVVLRARDIEEFGLTVRPETTVETLITAFRKHRDVENAKEVSLWWDGDRLEEHMTMEDAEIEDMDTIEVHIQ